MIQEPEDLPVRIGGPGLRLQPGRLFEDQARRVQSSILVSGNWGFLFLREHRRGGVTPPLPRRSILETFIRGLLAPLLIHGALAALGPEAKSPPGRGRQDFLSPPWWVAYPSLGSLTS